MCVQGAEAVSGGCQWPSCQSAVVALEPEPEPEPESDLARYPLMSPKTNIPTQFRDAPPPIKWRPGTGG
eukprot:260361-Chlamydomonas_euryale.AAC.1